MEEAARARPRPVADVGLSRALLERRSSGVRRDVLPKVFEGMRWSVNALSQSVGFTTPGAERARRHGCAMELACCMEIAARAQCTPRRPGGELVTLDGACRADGLGDDPHPGATEPM